MIIFVFPTYTVFMMTVNFEPSQKMLTVNKNVLKLCGYKWPKPFVTICYKKHVTVKQR